MLSCRARYVQCILCTAIFTRGMDTRHLHAVAAMLQVLSTLLTVVLLAGAAWLYLQSSGGSSSSRSSSSGTRSTSDGEYDDDPLSEARKIMVGAHGLHVPAQRWPWLGLPVVSESCSAVAGNPLRHKERTMYWRNCTPGCPSVIPACVLCCRTSTSDQQCLPGGHASAKLAHCCCQTNTNTTLNSTASIMAWQALPTNRYQMLHKHVALYSSIPPSHAHH